MSDSAHLAARDGDLARDVNLATNAHRRLDAALDELISTEGFDVAAPSRLPDWSKGHVLTHITNSGLGHVGIFDGAARGEVTAQYPHGVEGRAADIEAGAVRLAHEQVDAFRRANEQLEARYATTDYLRLELRRMEMLWTARQPMGLTPLPAAALALTPPQRLSWFVGRAQIEGLAPADVF